MQKHSLSPLLYTTSAKYTTEQFIVWKNMRTCYGYGFGLFCNMLFKFLKLCAKGSHSSAVLFHLMASLYVAVPRSYKKRSKLNFTTNYFIIVLPVLSYSGFNCVIFSVTSTSTEFLKEYKVIINGFTQAFFMFHFTLCSCYFSFFPSYICTSLRNFMRTTRPLTKVYKKITKVITY